MDQRVKVLWKKRGHAIEIDTRTGEVFVNVTDYHAKRTMLPSSVVEEITKYRTRKKNISEKNEEVDLDDLVKSDNSNRGLEDLRNNTILLKGEIEIRDLWRKLKIESIKGFRDLESWSSKEKTITDLEGQLKKALYQFGVEAFSQYEHDVDDDARYYDDRFRFSMTDKYESDFYDHNSMDDELPF